MKGVILCGEGLSDGRLKPITYSISRSMIPIANIPFIEYLLIKMVESGINNIAIVAGEGKNEYENYFKDGRDFNCRIKYYRQHKNSGTANQLMCAKHFVDDDNFVLALGNCFIDFSLEKYLKQFRGEKIDTLILTKEIEHPWKYDIAIFEKGKLLEIIRKPKITNSKTAVTGIFFFTPAILRAITRIKPNKRGEYELIDAIQYLIEKGYRVTTAEADGTWIEAARDLDLLECNKYILSRREDKKVIGKDTKLEDSTIGEFVSIAGSCHIKNSRVSNCIIMNECILNGVDLKDSIICEYSTIIGKGNLSGIMGPKTKLYLLENSEEPLEEEE